jgi:hypothetical protein
LHEADCSFAKDMLIVVRRYRYFYPDQVFLLNAAADWEAEFARIAIPLWPERPDIAPSPDGSPSCRFRR